MQATSDIDNQARRQVNDHAVLAMTGAFAHVVIVFCRRCPAAQPGPEPPGCAHPGWKAATGTATSAATTSQAGPRAASYARTVVLTIVSAAPGKRLVGWPARASTGWRETPVISPRCTSGNRYPEALDPSVWRWETPTRAGALR